MLIDAGADLNVQSGNAIPPTLAGQRRGGGRAAGQTALLIAARGGRLDIVEALIQAGADPKLKGADGTTLLMASAGSGKLNMVEYAFKFDQDVSAQNSAAQTAMHMAVTGSSGESTRVIQFLAEKGAELDLPDSSRKTPLDIAIADGNRADSVTLLIKLIAASGKTPREHLHQPSN
jgi:ankyrin repeat protein